MDLDELFMSEEEIAAANAIAGLKSLPGVEDISAVVRQATPEDPSQQLVRETQISKEIISDIHYDSIKTKYPTAEPDSIDFGLSPEVPRTPPEIVRAMGEEAVPLDELEAMFMPHSNSEEGAGDDSVKDEPSVVPSVTEGSATCPSVPQSGDSGADFSSEVVADSDDYIEAMFKEEEERNQQVEGGGHSASSGTGEVTASKGANTSSDGTSQQEDDQNKSEEVMDSLQTLDSLFRSISGPDQTSSSEVTEGGDGNSVEYNNSSVTNGTTSGLNSVEYSSGNMGVVLQGMNVNSGQIRTSSASAVPGAVENLPDPTQTVVTDLSSFLGFTPAQGDGFNYSSQTSQVYLVSSSGEVSQYGTVLCAGQPLYITTTVDVSAIQRSDSNDTVRALSYSSQDQGAPVGQLGKRQRDQNGDEGSPSPKIPRVTGADKEQGIPSSIQQNDVPDSPAENGSQRKRSKHSRAPFPILSERDVGIHAYINPNIKGFTGIIKERYEDFVVHEINEANELIHLTDLTCPPEEKKSVDVSGILSEHDKQSLEQLQVSSEKDTYHLIDVTSASKDERTKIHMAIKQNFQNLDSNTVELMDSKYVKIVKKAGGGKSRSTRWPKGRPKYCRFVLNKENIDSNEVLALMAKHLHIKPHAFQYAGSKDKRAITVQEMTIQKFEAQKLAKLNKKLRGVRVGNFRYVEKPLTLGELAGNHFEIILREVSGEQATIEKALKSLKENGFINYFGMQRFGNSTTATHCIGRAVLKNQWEEAIDLILQPRPGDNSPDSAWRKHWMDTKDAKSTLSRLPHDKKLSVEQQLLKSLSSSENDYCKAFASIPRNARMLYLHSYQSRVWNTVASKRIPKWGLYPSVGDLAARKSINNDKMSWICPEKVVDENLHKYSLEDIVLPLPGHTVHYPENEASTYTEILAQDGLTTEHLRHKIKDYSLPGAYRKLVVKPMSLAWCFIKYDDSKEKLIQSDLDRLEGIPAPVPKEDGKKLALKLSFSLPTSAYATMALRELMKTETSSSHHASLTQQHQNKSN